MIVGWVVIAFILFWVLSAALVPAFGMWGLIYSWLAVNVSLMGLGAFLILQKGE